MLEVLGEAMAVPKTVPLNPKTRAPRVEEWPTFFELIAEGESFVGACKMMGLHRHTVEYRIADDERLIREYMMARASRADTLAEKAIALAERLCPSGDEAVKAADVKTAADIFFKAAGQLDPKNWGQASTKTELVGKDGKDLELGNNVIIFQLPANSRD